MPSFITKNCERKYSELRQLILDALAPRKPNQEMVESFKTILKQKGEYRPMKLNPIVQAYGSLNVQNRPASAPRPKTNRIKSATKKRPSTACERTKSHEIFNSDLETEKKNRPANDSSSGSDTGRNQPVFSIQVHCSYGCMKKIAYIEYFELLKLKPFTSNYALVNDI